MTYHANCKSLLQLFTEHFTDQSMDDRFLLTVFELFSSEGVEYRVEIDVLISGFLDQIETVTLNTSLVARLFWVFRGVYRETGKCHLGEELFSRLQGTTQVEKAVRLLMVGMLSDDRHMISHLGERMKSSQDDRRLFYQ